MQFLEKLKEIRWVCARCLRVIRAPLKFSTRWGSGNRIKEITTVWGPRCCGVDMLIAGEPKEDIHGLGPGPGQFVDPVDNLRLHTKVAV